jgi:hypothetical protein
MSDQDSEGGGGEGGHKRRRLEGVIPDLLKRAVEIGVEKATEAPESFKHFVGEMKMPKEVAQYLLSQVDETKDGVFRVVAGEVRNFLEHANLAHEMQKVLTSLQFEINTTIRFSPADREAKPQGEGEGTEEGAPKEGTAETRPKPHVHTEVYAKPRRGRRNR